MGVKSTKCMTRKEMISHICDMLESPELWDNFTDKQIEDMAEELAEKSGDSFTNYRIVKEEDKSNYIRKGWLF